MERIGGGIGYGSYGVRRGSSEFENAHIHSGIIETKDPMITRERKQRGWGPELYPDGNVAVEIRCSRRRSRGMSWNEGSFGVLG